MQNDVKKRLSILADAAKYDASCASSGGTRKNEGGLGNSEGMGICHSYTPDGRCVSLLKILLTNICVFDCQYCVNRISSETERARFTPAEVAELTVEFYRRNYIEGLFLSSGVIKSPDYTMEQLIEVARLLREQHKFFGYVHLKAVPGASAELYLQAGRYADRLSANIELASDGDLTRLAPEKSHAHVDAAMHTIAGGILEARERPRPEQFAPAHSEDGTPVPRRRHDFAPAGQSTQMLVGAGTGSDRQILHTADRLYGSHGLRRVYYSAFSPIPHADPRLPPKAPPLVREHRLYQADWLMRHYGFAAGELTDEAAPDLALDIDPKLAWALAHRAFFPLDLNRASREQLLRVPGLGVRSVDRVLRQRRVRALRMADLAALRVPLWKVEPFVFAEEGATAARLLDAASLVQRLRPAQQLGLFESA